MTKKHTAPQGGQAAALPEANQGNHAMNTQANPDLIQYTNGGVTLSARRTHVCLNSAWEIEGLCRLLANLPNDDEGLNDLVRRGLCARILVLSNIVMSGLSSADEKTIGLETVTYVKLRGEIEG